MLVATPGQTTSYSTLHNSSSNGSNNTTTATSSTKKTSTSSTTGGNGKPLSNNTNHASSIISNKSSLNLNTNSTTHSYQSNTKNENTVHNKLNNQNKSAALSTRETISCTKQVATTHSSKTENSTKTTITTNNKQPSFIQTLKDSVQKALISTTGGNSISTAIKYSTDNKLQNNCNNSKTSANNVTSSSSSTSHNANKLSTITSSNNSTVMQSSSSAAVARSKYFSCSISKLHTVAPTIIHRHPEERQRASSTDSLHKEMCHFKPIRIVPKTPWKSGSKSRGNSLRFPKAKHATKKIEFVLKSNCDVNNRKKKQQIDKINVGDDDDDDNGQENDEFHKIYKPKPSLTSLSTSFNTPNHTSAFVCLVADMKNLANLQSKNQLTSTFEEEPDDSINVLLSRKKQRQSKKQPQVRELIKETSKKRVNRQPPKITTKEIIKQTNPKKSTTSKDSTAAVTKTKSTKNVGSTKGKGKLVNSVSMPVVGTVAAEGKGRRKRKITHEDIDSSQLELISTLNSSPLPKKSTSNKSVLSTARKSSRLSAMRMSATANKRLRYSKNRISPQTTIKSALNSQVKPTTVVSFSPIMTRSRHKLLVEQGKIVEAVVPIIAKLKKS